jgi:hypothetical protein
VKKRIIAVVVIIVLLTPCFAFADFKARKSEGTVGGYNYLIDLDGYTDYTAWGWGYSTYVHDLDTRIHISRDAIREGLYYDLTDEYKVLVYNYSGKYFYTTEGNIPDDIILSVLQKIHADMCNHESGDCIFENDINTGVYMYRNNGIISSVKEVFGEYATEMEVHLNNTDDLEGLKDIIDVLYELTGKTVYNQISMSLDNGSEALAAASATARDAWIKEITEKFEAITSAPGSATAEEWKTAAQAYAAGVQTTWLPSGIPSGNFTEKENAEITAIYASPFSIGAERGTPSRNWDPSIGSTPLDPLLPAYANEFRDIYQNIASESPNLSGRMSTFPSRVRFLTVKSKSVGSDQDAEQAFIEIKDYVGHTAYTSLLWPALTGLTTPQLNNWFDAEAYTLLLATLSEVDSYRGTIIPVIAPMLVDDSSAQKDFSKSMLTGLLAVKEGLDYINAGEVWELWRKPYVEPQTSILGGTATEDVDIGEFDTLEKIYNKLMEIQAFDGISSYDVGESDEPLRVFFSEAEKKFSTDYLKGVALSSMYIPAHTNMYDPLTIQLYEKEEGVQYDFNYKYAFNRKALYIDTNADSAVKLARTNQKGETRVATLKDLMFADKDIVLYLDDNFYNIKQLAELQNKAMNRLDNVDSESDTQGAFGRFWDWATDVFNTSIYELAKSSEEVLYCTRDWTNHIKDYNEEDDESETGLAALFTGNNAILASSKIDEYINEKDYSFMQSFAVTSAVYRHEKLLNALNTYLRGTHPVFVSSPNLPFLVDASSEDRNTIYNYLLLKNIEPNMPIGYATNLDMNSPLYMDIYGNIITESGTVIIPAASNTTLHRSGYSPYNAGLLSTYGDAYRLKYDETQTEFNKVMSKFFEKDEETGYWVLKSIQSMNGNFDVAALSTGSQETLKALMDMYAYELDTNALQYRLVSNNIIEVLRGAPLEEIDKNEEGLNVNRRLTKRGVLAAAKLEEITDSLAQKDINTAIALPNLAYIDGLEYIILFAYKIIVLIMLVIWMATIYLDAVGHKLSWRTPVKCMGVLLLVVSLIIIVPAVFEVTYYQSNKWLLQKEAGYLQMLNLEKQAKGVEIGVTEIQEPDTSTKLMLKMDDIRYHWYDLFGDIVTSSTFESLEQIYEEYNDSSEIVFANGMEVMNDAVYFPTENLFSSTDIVFSPISGNIMQSATGGTEASFYTPYYAFLDVLLYRVNTYNFSHKTYAYTTTVQSMGKVKTLGIIKPFLESTEFMGEDTQDVLSLRSIYGLEDPTWFSESSIEAMGQSQWCNKTIEADQILKRIELISKHAREYVSENLSLIGRVTDETFLKSMALDLAMYHNRVFNTQRADTLEMYNFSNEDLMRMAIAQKDLVMRNSPMSFARFVYECGSTITVYAVGLLMLVMFIGGWIKPFATIAIFLIVFSSLFVYKIILRNKTKGYLGYIITISSICGMNIAYSLLLKLSVYLPNAGFSTTVCIIVQIVLQVLYLWVLLKVVITALANWKNVGFEKYMRAVDNLTMIKPNAPRRKYRDGWEYYNELTDSQHERLTGKRSRTESEVIEDE